MIKRLAIMCAAFATGPASAETYVDPTPLSEMLKRGYKIMAVVAPPYATRDMEFGSSENDALKRNAISRKQREIYLQNGFDAAVCFWDLHRAKGGCYSLTVGEN